jgi:5-formaminoimidazole-4-carboxamide-1-beta-D-ribofuranosyl 5'-monophosphate synthetase
MFLIFSVSLCVGKKMALLVFEALARVSAKTKCAICGSAFYTDAQLANKGDKITTSLPYL